MLTQKPKGTQDTYGVRSYHWHWIEQIMRETGECCGATEIRTPMFEHTELFLKNVGETTDIVNKEMYTFNDKGGRSLTLKPEGTAGVVRVFVEDKLYANPQPTKFYYMTSVFRAENPQKGRFREHHQFGVEFMGSYEPEADVEVIAVGKEVLDKAGIKATLHINSIGEKEAREAYHNVIKSYIGGNINAMCKDCKERFEKNPLRSLDCKQDACKKIMENAPSILDYLTAEDKAHFDRVLALLDKLGIDYVVDPKVVRGLDYYTRTVFEFIFHKNGQALTVCGGGRYDNVIEQTGGPKMGSVGFGMGMERLIICLEEMGALPDIKPRRDIFIGYIGEKGKDESQKIAYELRRKGILADSDILSRSLKAQMKYADKLNSRYSVILGDSEIESGVLSLKDMDTGESVDIEISGIYEFIKEKKGSF